jgi:hypothetical protein
MRSHAAEKTGSFTRPLTVEGLPSSAIPRASDNFSNPRTVAAIVIDEGVARMSIKPVRVVG